MDAKIGDYVATPRHGKPVEIQALWYNALCFTESLANKFGDGEVERLIAASRPEPLKALMPSSGMRMRAAFTTSSTATIAIPPSGPIR